MKFHLSLIAFTVLGAAAQTPAPVVRIGVFDTRAIAIAYLNSPEFQQGIQALRAEHAKAQEAGDEKRARQLQQEGEWGQVRAHQQGFSTGPVSMYLEKVSGQIPAVAGAAGVVAIVSKWETPYLAAGVEQVDVTLELVKLFHPSERVLKMVEQMKGRKPVPFDKLPLDPKM